MSYHTSYAFAAPPEVVHSVMNDLDLLARWLGEELPHTSGNDMSRYTVRTGPSPLELSWTPVPEPDGWPGRAVVRALPVGGSVVDVRIGVPVAFRTRINHIDRIVAHVLRRIDAEAGYRSGLPRSSPGGTPE